MGIIYVEERVKEPQGEATVRFLVDSGATYSLLPERMWQSIGLTPKREHTFVLADGRTIERKVSECYLVLPPFGEGHTPVILGEADDEALLGVVTFCTLVSASHSGPQRANWRKALSITTTGHS